MIINFHTPQRYTPLSITQRYPSVIRLNFIPTRVKNYNIPKKLLTYTIITLKTNKSTKIHIKINVENKYIINHYQKINFFPIVNIPKTPDDIIYLNKTI